MRGGMLCTAGCDLHWGTCVKLGGFPVVGLVPPNQGFSIDGRRARVNMPGRWSRKGEDFNGTEAEAAAAGARVGLAMEAD